MAFFEALAEVGVVFSVLLSPLFRRHLRPSGSSVPSMILPNSLRVPICPTLRVGEHLLVIGRIVGSKIAAGTLAAPGSVCRLGAFKADYGGFHG
jgi:hypothetical protein